MLYMYYCWASLPCTLLETVRSHSIFSILYCNKSMVLSPIQFNYFQPYSHTKYHIWSSQILKTSASPGSLLHVETSVRNQQSNCMMISLWTIQSTNMSSYSFWLEGFTMPMVSLLGLIGKYDSSVLLRAVYLLQGMWSASSSSATRRVVWISIQLSLIFVSVW